MLANAPLSGIEAEEATVKAPAALLHIDTFTDVCSGEKTFDSDSLQASLKKLREGGVFLAAAAIWVPPKKSRTPAAAMEYVERTAACIKKTINEHSGELLPALTSEDAEKALKNGRTALLISVEGGEALLAGNDAVERLWRMGARSVSLTWSRSNALAASSGDGKTGGLTAGGRNAVRKMNRLGMMIDVSHASDGTVSDVLEASKAPVFASHSNCRELGGGTRNLPGDLIAAIAKGGGVVGLSFHLPHISACASGIDGVMAHAKCVKNYGGEGALALGSDYDGRIHAAKELEDASKIQALAPALKNAGFSDAGIKGVMSGNFLRFWKKAEEKADGKIE
jgi:membrane dipeptidase